MFAHVDVSQTAAGAVLSLDRHDITFHSPNPEEVAVAVSLKNGSSTATAPTRIHVEAAPLGAFLPWRPLAYALLPEIPAGQTHSVEFTVQRPHTHPLGRGGGEISAARLQSALAMGEPLRHGEQILNLPADNSGTIAVQTNALPHDVFELFGHVNPHWAGNLKARVGEASAERHLAQSLRIRPGRENFAFLMIGSGRDAYAFKLDGAPWGAALYHRHTQDLRAFLPRVVETDPIEQGEWLEIHGQGFLVLALNPPAGSGSGDMNVEVTQRSTGRTTVVEFSFHPRAAGPGCFVVE